MRRIEEGVAAITAAIADGLTFYNLSIAKRSVKPAIFHFSTICLTYLLITTISSSFFLSDPLLSTTHGQRFDTIDPVLTVPDDFVVNATTEEDAEVSYTVTAEDNVDGTAILEQDGSTLIQDDVGGNITISCEPASGFEFPIGTTTVECIATDASSNEGEGFFTITVEAVVEPPPTITEPLTAEIISNGTEGVAPATFELEANIIGGTEPYIYSWDFDNGGSENSNDETVEHTFEEAGIHNVVLTVIDSNSLTASDDIAITVTGEPPNGWIIIPLVVLASIVIGGIALGKYKMNRRSSHRIKIPPSAIVEIRAKGGIDQ
jgi:hypothetical protein